MRLRKRHRRAIARVTFASLAGLLLGAGALLLVLGLQPAMEALHDMASSR
jgi:hypothetical protein